jgi:hypothetical protein
MRKRYFAADAKTLFLATHISASQWVREQCRAEAHGWSTVGSPPISGGLCRRKTTMRRKLVGLRRRRGPGCMAKFLHERNAALLDNQMISNQQVSQHIQPNHSQRNVGNTMLVPVIIFLMILSPVLIPAVVTLVDVMRRKRRPAGTAGHPRSLASGRFAAVPAAA